MPQDRRRPIMPLFNNPASLTANLNGQWVYRGLVQLQGVTLVWRGGSGTTLLTNGVGGPIILRLTADDALNQNNTTFPLSYYAESGLYLQSVMFGSSMTLAVMTP